MRGTDIEIPFVAQTGLMSARARTCRPCGPVVVGGQFQSAAVHMEASVAPRPQPTTQSWSMSSAPASDFCLIQFRTASISPRIADWSRSRPPVAEAIDSRSIFLRSRGSAASPLVPLPLRAVGRPPLPPWQRRSGATTAHPDRCRDRARVSTVLCEPSMS